MNVREIWSPKTLTASGVIVDMDGALAGFLCTTGGTVQITAGIASGGATIVPAFTAVAGTYYPMPFRMKDGAYAVLTTAQGVFAVGA
jgi:hypothetical protein